MLKISRELIAPAYLLACLLLGGSVQAIWGNMLLQLAGVVLIAWAATERSPEPPAPAARHLLLLALAGVTVVVVQLIPLPASVWPSLGGRHQIAAGYQILGLPLPALPVSLAPYRSLDALLAFIPPVAMVCAILRLRAYRPSWLAAALVAGAVGGVLLGALQVGSTDQATSPWYLYEDTNLGRAVGFFANANHMAILLVVTLPFLAAVITAARHGTIQRRSALYAMVAGTALVILVGVMLNGSLAGMGLTVAVAAACLLILLPGNSRLRPAIAVAAALLLVGVIGFLAQSSIGNPQFQHKSMTSVETRAEIMRSTTRAIGDFMPFGSGLGTFPGVYNLYEDPARVTTTRVIHAHNDYAELALELGIAGIALMMVFLGWWAMAVWRVWRSAEAGPFIRAASIASAAILAHSIVDFPLRTAAIASTFAMCIALLGDRRGAPPPVNATDLRPTRHFVYR